MALRSGTGSGSAVVTLRRNEEQATTSKDARVVEELEIGKTPTTDTERVSGTVRREEFDIDSDGDVNRR